MGERVQFIGNQSMIYDHLLHFNYRLWMCKLWSSGDVVSKERWRYWYKITDSFLQIYLSISLVLSNQNQNTIVVFIW